MKSVFDGIKNFFKVTFLPPARMNWGYPVFVMSLGVVTVYLIKILLFHFEMPFSPTSIAFNALIIPLLTLIALIIPAISLASVDNNSINNGIAGKFTGIGPLLIALVSGVPLSLVNTACHNLSTYGLLRFGRTMIYPAFMCYNQDESLISTLLEITTTSIIPALGVSIFFTGFLWSLFKDENKPAGTIVIIIFYVLYNLNLIDALGAVVIGWWIVKLRKKTGTIAAPFLALSAMKIAEVCLRPIISQIDITDLQTYSDIPSTFFYASVPAVFVGIILFAFFNSSLDEFERIYNSDLLGREEVQASTTEHNLPFVKGFNVSLLLAVLILGTIWTLMILGIL